MKRIKIICIILLIISTQSYSQIDSVSDKIDRPFRIELEPSSYIVKGWSLLGSYGITKDRNLHVGLYTMASVLPPGFNISMFNNATREDEIRLTFELASTFRYKIPYALNNESNPYIGLFFGWETFRHTNANNGDITKMSNFFLTPQIGYEIYIFRQMVYLNPSVRVVYEFGRESDYNNPQNPDDVGPIIQNWLWLPSFSIGVRL